MPFTAAWAEAGHSNPNRCSFPSLLFVLLCTPGLRRRRHNVASHCDSQFSRLQPRAHLSNVSSSPTVFHSRRKLRHDEILLRLFLSSPLSLMIGGGSPSSAMQQQPLQLHCQRGQAASPTAAAAAANAHWPPPSPHQCRYSRRISVRCTPHFPHARSSLSLALSLHTSRPRAHVVAFPLKLL